MRALWTAASGMQTQQMKIDNISNNLANVNTTGYKKQRVEFKDLLYETVKKPNATEGEGGSPVNLQIGHGVTAAGTSRDFTVGGPERTDKATDMMIDGKGFFVIEDQNENRYYTRDGSFKWSIDGDTKRLVTTEGYTVLSEDESPIEFDGEAKDVKVNEDGYISYKDEDGESVEIGRIMLANFLNPDGLESQGNNLLTKTEAAGEEIILEDENRDSKIMQGFLEGSNVQLVDEMIKLIVAQRAYDTNSKSIQTVDEMMQTTNNLRR